MRTKKMSLANIQGKLSRTEMKNIMAGSASCSTTDCFGFVNGTIKSAICTTDTNGACKCPINASGFCG